MPLGIQFMCPKCKNVNEKISKAIGCLIVIHVMIGIMKHIRNVLNLNIIIGTMM